MISPHTFKLSVSEHNYLQSDKFNIKHKLLDNQIYAIAEISKNHNLLSGNIFTELEKQRNLVLPNVYG